jgi:hypothetical protein
MKIKREFNGATIEIELTESEIFEASREAEIIEMKEVILNYLEGECEDIESIDNELLTREAITALDSVHSGALYDERYYEAAEEAGCRILEAMK